jgi:coiled-coil domain-containing protein 64
MGDCEEIENNEDLIDEKSELDSKHHYNFQYELENEFLGDENYNDVNNEEEDDLYVILAQKDKDLLLAAELGKALLEKNEELTQKYERLQEEYSLQAEVSFFFMNYCFRGS